MFPSLWGQINNFTETALYYIADTFHLAGFFADHAEILDFFDWIRDDLFSFIFDIVPSLVFGVLY